MTAIEIKKEISKALDQIPDNILVDILNLIREVQTENSSATLTSNLKKILSEDGDLLNNLAQ